MFGCKHNWVINYTNVHYSFTCTKCGKRARGVRTYRRKTKKQIAIISIGLAVVFLFILTGGVLQLPQISIPNFMETKPSQTPSETPQGQTNQPTSSGNSQVVLSNCIMTSNGAGGIRINCADHDSVKCSSDPPIGSGIQKDVTLTIDKNSCIIQFPNPQGSDTIYHFQLGTSPSTTNTGTNSTSPTITIPKVTFPKITLPKFSDLPNIKMPISIPNAISNLTTIASKPQQLLQEITKPQQTSISDSQQAIDYLNKIRTSNGVKPISFDQRVFDVALARAKDNYDYGYFDHTNPKTGTCSYTIKSQFGLTSNEDVAENLYMEGYSGSPALTNPQLTSVIDSWMSDFGHKHNLLFPDHVSGAVACYGGVCAFEGLNYQEFGHGCYTASQGEAQFGKLDNCSQEQLNQYLALEQKLDAMKPLLQGMPSVASSQAQYDYYNGLVTQYNNLVNQIDNFSC